MAHSGMVGPDHLGPFLHGAGLRTGVPNPEGHRRLRRIVAGSSVISLYLRPSSNSCSAPTGPITSWVEESDLSLPLIGAC